MDRRTFVAGLAALPSLAAARNPRSAAVPLVIATGLAAPESPKPLDDGGVLVCEMARGTLSRVAPDGTVRVVASLGGSPNGCALLGPRSALVCNNGGLTFRPDGGLLMPAGRAPDARGRIERVDLRSGASSWLYGADAGRPLVAPNDLVIDRRGGFWFTDSRLVGPDGQTLGAVFHAAVDGSALRLVAHVTGANGIALSPGGEWLYVVQSRLGRIVRLRVVAAGVVALDANGRAKVEPLVEGPGDCGFDSMAVDRSGALVVGTLRRAPFAVPAAGALAVYGASGLLLRTIPLDERFVTSVGFGGPGRRTAYVTLTTSGRLVAVPWPVAGVRLAAG